MTALPMKRQKPSSRRTARTLVSARTPKARSSFKHSCGPQSRGRYAKQCRMQLNWFKRHVTTCSKTSRTSDWRQLVPLYDPATKTQQTIDARLKKLDSLAEALSWNYLSTTAFALTRLKGVARTWYHALANTRPAWSEWKYELVRAVFSGVGFQHLFREMKSRRKQQKESI